jgi:hypothetical protein
LFRDFEGAGFYVAAALDTLLQSDEQAVYRLMKPPQSGPDETNPEYGLK